MTVVLLLSVAMVGGTFVLVPQLSRATVPLGVSVPSDRVAEPVVRAALRRYQVACAALTLVACAGTFATAALPATNVWWLLGLVAACLVAYAGCRRPILQAKRDRGWYEGVRVRVGASVTPDRPVRIAWPPHLLSIGLALAALAFTAWAYPALPDPLPMHYNAAGEIDRWEPKSWLGALGPSLIALGTAVFMLGSAWLAVRTQAPHLPDGHPDAARAAQRRKARSGQVAIGLISVPTTVILAGLGLVPLLRLTPNGFTAVMLGGLAATTLPIIWLIVDAARAQHAAAAEPGASGPESPDDDALWKAGLFYYNPANPNLLVPKRAGVGHDINVGHPVGMALGCLIALLMIVTILLPLLIP